MVTVKVIKKVGVNYCETRSISKFNILNLCKSKCGATNVYFSSEKKRDHFVHSGPQGCIVYDDDYEEVFLKRGSH